MSGPAVPGEIAGERAGDFILYRTPGEPRSAFVQGSRYR